MWVPWCVAVLAVAVVADGKTSIKTFACDQDTSFCEDKDGALANGVGEVLFTGRTKQGALRRAMVRFDLRAHGIPDDAEVTDVNISLHVIHVPPLDPSENVTFHRVTADWGTGASNTTLGSCAPAEKNDATWLNTFYPDKTWQVAGGDFAAQLSAVTPVRNIGRYNFSSPGLIEDVRKWLRGQAPNYGWFILGDESKNETAKELGSKEHSERPMLHIEWHVPNGKTGGSSKDAVRIALPIVFVGLALCAAAFLIYRKRRGGGYTTLMG